MSEKVPMQDQSQADIGESPYIRLRTPGLREVLDGELPLGEPWGDPEPGFCMSYNPNTGEFNELKIVVQAIKNPRFV